MAIYESEKMERHIVRLLQNEGLLGKVLLMKPYLALQQVKFYRYTITNTA